MMKFAVLALAACAATPKPVAPTLPAGITEHDGVVGDLSLHYLQAGQGDPIVLLHGFAETSHMWLPAMEALSSDHTVIAIDLPGAGGSSRPATGYEKKLMAQEIHTLVHSLGYAKVQVVGHDIGLMVAYAYAAQFPDETSTLTLMDAFIPGVGAFQDVFLLRDKWHFNFYGPTPEALVAGRERTYLEHFWNDFAADPKHSVSEADRVYYASEYAKAPGMRSTFAYFAAFDTDNREFAELAKTPIAMPILVLAGEKASGEFLITQGKLVGTNVTGIVIPGAGHWLIDEARERTVAELVKFLRAPAK